MKRVLSILTLLLLPILILGSIGRAYAQAYDESAMSGEFTCTGATLLNGQAIAAGTASLVADGSGKWTAGTASYQITSGQAQGGNCNYTLDHGEYVVNSDGTGTSVTNWRLVKPQSSTACAASASGAAKLWVPDGSYWGSSDGVYQYGSCATIAQAQ